MKNLYKSMRASLMTGMMILCCGSLFAQPANDDLCDAQILVVDAVCTTPNGSNTGATAQTGEPFASCFNGGLASAWFKFAAPASGYVNVTTDISVPGVTNTDTELALYTLTGGNCTNLGGLTQIACDQDGGTAINFNSIVSQVPVTPGDTIWVQVSGWGTNPAQGAFCIEVEEAAAPPAPPANDDVCGAQVLNVGDACTTPNGTNVSSTSQPGEPFASCFQGGLASVWFKFVAPASGFVTVTTDIDVPGVTNDDTEIAIYSLTGGDCSNLGSLTQIACDQDGGVVVGAPFGTYNSIITAAAVPPGDTIWIQVSGWGTTPTTGDFCIEVIEVVPPENDNLCDAEALTLGDACTPGSLENATFQPGETSGSCSFNSSSVWYSFVAPASGFVNVVTTASGDADITLYALPGGSCTDISDLFQVVCATGTGGSARLDTILVAPGLTYYAQVSGGSSTFCIEAEGVTPSVLPVFPANDSLCNAIPVVVDAACTSPIGDNTGATAQIGEPIPGCFSGGANSIWYSFVAPGSGLVTISTDIDVPGLTNDDTEIALYELPGGDCTDLSDLVELACDQDGGSVVGFGWMSIISQQALTPGETYYIQVSGWNGTEGAFCMEIEQLFVPPSDDVCDAIALPVDGSVSNFYNTNATTQTGEDLISPPLAGAFAFTGWTDTDINNSVWFTFVAPASGAVAIDLCNDGVGTDFDSKVAVYQVGNCADFATFSFLAGNDDLQGCATASYVEVGCLMPDSTYYILVDGWEGDQGNFGISIIDTVVTTALTTSLVNPTCEGDTDGSASVSALGGGPFSYIWSTGATTTSITGLAAGTYTVGVINACGDTTTASVTLSDPDSLVVFATPIAPSCAGATDGGATLAVTGGSAPFTFNWSSGQTIQNPDDLAPGNYIVFVQDACATVATVSVTVPEATPVAVDAGADTTVCVDGTVTLGGALTASGGVARTINRIYAVEGFFDLFLGIKVEDVTKPDTIAATITPFVPAGDFGGDGLFYGINSTSGTLITIDTTTGAITTIGPLGLAGSFTGMGWNAADSTMYALLVAGTTNSTLCTIDLATGAATALSVLAGSAGTLPIWLAINNDGGMYAMDIVAEVLQVIDPVAFTITAVGPTGLNTNFAQDADFDPVTGELYLAAFSGVGPPYFTDMYTADITTGATTFVGRLPVNAEITAMAISPVTITPYEYTWVPAAGLDDPTAANPVATITATTEYIVSVLDACGVLISDTIVVSVPQDVLEATADGVQDNGDDSGSAWVNVTGGLAPYTIAWSNGATTDTITGLAFGLYTAIITDACGGTTEASFEVSDNTSIKALLAVGVNVFEAFPNPSSGVFTLRVELADLGDLSISLYDVNGKALYKENALRTTNFEKVLDVSRQAASGIYILEIRTAKGLAHKRINIH